ncbi:MAG: hypothetical protein LC721_10720, partial [Actinobacteria bacterium]|nr:hypothetical protein [Actinomycetota bacterium]
MPTRPPVEHRRDRGECSGQRPQPDSQQVCKCKSAENGCGRYDAGGNERFRPWRSPTVRLV